MEATTRTKDELEAFFDVRRRVEVLYFLMKILCSAGLYVFDVCRREVQHTASMP